MEMDPSADSRQNMSIQLSMAEYVNCKEARSSHRKGQRWPGQARLGDILLLEYLAARLLLEKWGWSESDPLSKA